MSFLAGTAIEVACLAAAIITVVSVALYGSISILNKRREDPWDALPEVEKKLNQRLREAGE